MSSEFWFKPKTLGYGATPTTWEGWAVVAVYSLVVLGCVVAMTVRKDSFSTFVSSIAMIVVATVVLVVVSVQKTDGTWRWNAGANQMAGKKD
jgi:uncharacterized membrane protein AbrB (regulator of aidB expression)